MAFPQGRNVDRWAYEDHFSGADSREVTVHRVVNIVEKRNPMPRQNMEYARDDQWYGGTRNYQDAREDLGEGSYPTTDRQYFDEHSDFSNFRRNTSPPRNEGSYSPQPYGRDDLRHQLGSRNSRRGDPYFSSRGQGSGPPLREDHDVYRSTPQKVIKRERSPGRREAHPAAPVRSGSNTSNRSFSPDRERSLTYQQAQKKHKVSVSHTPSSSVEGSPLSSGSSKEKTPASVAETEEVVAASMEPKLTPDEDFKARRSEAIKTKALEIEKHYRQDCETFRTVVKMLVAKEPSLDNLLQAPLDDNLLEIKQRCLDALRHFVKELDEVLKQPQTPA
ncbi:periphilin-1 isoform X2 [Cottoperca gobio]|nr:periphilin-1-like isoform X2 [Cottoperca gobio]XP_029290109.1 periphilin-1-like isoform X2 [Cottoperca gobio]